MTKLDNITVTEPTVNVLNFQLLRDALARDQEQAPLGFDMRSFYNIHGDCGTTACLAGWAWTLKHGSVGPVKSSTMFVMAREWLGLGLKPAIELFGLTTAHTKLAGITQQQAIDHLDEIIAAGEYVPWPFNANNQVSDSMADLISNTPW